MSFQEMIELPFNIFLELHNAIYYIKADEDIHQTLNFSHGINSNQEYLDVKKRLIEKMIEIPDDEFDREGFERLKNLIGKT